MRRVVTLMMAVVIVSVVTGCDTGNDEGGDTEETTLGDDPDGGGDGGDGDDGDGDGDDQASTQVEYPAGGPVDNVFPPGDPAYRYLSEGDCASLLTAANGWEDEDVAQNIADVEGADTISLYQAAGAACRGDFAAAATALGEIGSPPDFKRNLCSRTVVLAWTRDLVQASQSDPGFDPEFVRSDDANPCPDDETEEQGTTEETTDDTSGDNTGDTTEDTAETGTDGDGG